MSKNDNQRDLIQQYLSTRRRISEMEQKALKKIGSSSGKREAPACSFCGRLESEESPLIK